MCVGTCEDEESDCERVVSSINTKNSDTVRGVGGSSECVYGYSRIQRWVNRERV
jgi:hypothetical protein